MPKKTAQPGKIEAERIQTSLQVEHYDARVQAAINHNIYAPEYDWLSDERDPVHEFESRVDITGAMLGPKDRTGDTYELTIYGDDSPSRRLNTTLKDAQARDEHRSLKYRKYRGRQIPIYDVPKGMGVLEKIRGERYWRGWFAAPTRFVGDLITLLQTNRPLFISIDEWKIERLRWIRGVSLQTTDPRNE